MTTSDPEQQEPDEPTAYAPEPGANEEGEQDAPPSDRADVE